MPTRAQPQNRRPAATHSGPVRGFAVARVARAPKLDERGCEGAHKGLATCGHCSGPLLSPAKGRAEPFAGNRYDGARKGG
jgi:hypothetical protein